MNRSQGLVTHSNDVCFWAQGRRGKLIVADDRGCELLHAREPGVKHTFCTRSEVIDVGWSCLFHLIVFIKFVFCKSPIGCGRSRRRKHWAVIFNHSLFPHHVPPKVRAQFSCTKLSVLRCSHPLESPLNLIDFGTRPNQPSIFYLQAPRAAYGPVAGTTDTCSTQVGPGLSRGGGRRRVQTMSRARASCGVV